MRHTMTSTRLEARHRPQRAHVHGIRTDQDVRAMVDRFRSRVDARMRAMGLR